MDISLGHYTTADAVDRALQALGEGDSLVRYRDVFAEQDVDDVTWLNVVAEKNWVVLTKDEQIRKNPLELQALRQGRVAVFMLSRGELSGDVNGRLIALALPRMRRLLLDYGRPLIVVIQRSGALSVVEGARVRKSARPKRPKPKRRKGRSS